MLSLLKNTVGYLITSVIILGLIESVLSFLPVNSAIRTEPLSGSSTPFEVSAKKSTNFSFSTMWYFNNPQWRKTNKAGFFSDFEYEDGFDGYVVVGDSQVEAVQVPFSVTFHQQLSKKLGEKVYNVGLSGAPLSQYHAYINEVCYRYKPKKIIVLLIPNDFKQSLKSHRIRNGWFHYDENGVLKPTPYIVTWFRSLANKSSLAQYVYFNLRAGGIYRQFFINYSGQEIDQNKLKLKTENLLLDKKAIDFFFKSFSPTCVRKSEVLFVTDGNRYSPDYLESNVYSKGGKNIPSFEYFKKVASANNFATLDLQTFLRADYLKYKKKFETIYDSHWNERGHDIAAQAIFDHFKK